MADNCGGCHGPRVADEYQGNNEGIPAALHWVDLDMPCAACHGGELHGGEAVNIDRYQSGTSVSCRDCHADVIAAADNEQHNRHIDDFTCQSCHSVEYRNCFNCHVGKDDAGAPYFTIDPSVMMFKIGLNPIRSADRPEKFAVLRHVPVAADTFEYYGDNLLPDFDNSPTWKYATPHNIQLKTPQNASCFACHNNPTFFLASDDIPPGERAANRAVTILEPGP